MRTLVEFLISKKYSLTGCAGLKLNIILRDFLIVAIEFRFFSDVAP